MFPVVPHSVRSLIASKEDMLRFLEMGKDSVFSRVKMGTDHLFPAFCVSVKRRPNDLPEGQLMLMGSDLGDRKKRAELFADLGNGYYDRQEMPFMAVLVCESYIAPKGWKEAPEKCPDAKEGVYAVVGNLSNREFYSAAMEITREEGLIVGGTFSEVERIAMCPPLYHFYLGFYKKQSEKMSNVAKAQVN